MFTSRPRATWPRLVAEGTAVDLAGRSVLGKDRFDFRETFLHLLRGQNKRRQQAQDVVVRAVDQQALFQRFGNVRSALDVQIDAEHQAFAANFADEIEFRGHFFQARLAVPRRARGHWRATVFVSTVSRNVKPVAQVSGPPPNVEP